MGTFDLISIVKGARISAAFLLGACIFAPFQEAYAKDQSSSRVQVGLVHSLSGSMAVVEKGLVAAELLAIEQINADGGLLVDGRQYFIDALIKDGASRWPVYARQAEQLIERNRVPVLFGGWTSASRKAMLPVVESKNSLLFYPLYYEGQECSKNIFYTGATPSQQSEPATRFMFERSPAAGQPFFLVGSDYVFPRTSHAITKTQLKSLGGAVVGEEYLPLGDVDVSGIIEKIKASLPNGGVIINHFNGDQNIAFFRELRRTGLTPSNGYYVMSYSILEDEISLIGPDLLKGHYGAWNYVMSDPSLASRRFVAAFRQRFGERLVLSDPHESAYNMIYLWKAGVEKANSFAPEKVAEALVGIRFDAPQGKVEVMPNHHLAQTVRIAQITAQGNYKTVSQSRLPVKPTAWSQFESFSRGYGCDWTDPAKGERYRLRR